jgi:TolA-binding protein
VTPDTCPRAWEAEAAEDGRLGAAEKLAFERHASTCPACKREVAALASLRAIMNRSPVLTSTPFDKVRLRTSLLRRANAQMVGAPSGAWARTLAFAALGVACMLVLGAWRLVADHRSSRAALAQTRSTPRFDVQASDSAGWADRSEGSLGRIALKSGVTAIHVEHLEAGQRFLAILPDGEIEVHGTRFTVTIHEHHTDRVQVTEGVVSLRLDGSAERTLNAGDGWERAPTHESAASGEPTERVAAAEPANTEAEPRDPRLEASDVESPAATPARVHPGSESLVNSKQAASGRGGRAGLPSSADLPPGDEPRTPARAFSAAMAAFHRGAYSDAETLFTGFTSQFPRDPRSEDAAFLRAVARSRQGDAAGAAALARQYLQQYPHGLRRSDAERLVGAK